MNAAWMRRISVVVMLCAVALAAVPTNATVWRVPGDGVEVTVVIDSLAAPGDTVQVLGNGGATFYNRITLDKDLRIEGGWRADFQVRDPSIYVTVFQDIADAFQNERAILRINGSHRVEVDGITFIGGRFGIRADDGADLVVRDCLIRGQINATVPSEGFRLSGGGIRMVGGTLLVENTTIRNTRALIHGAGVALRSVSTATIRDSVIRNCISQFPSAGVESNGAGIYAIDVGSLTLERDELQNNTSLDRGGHLFASNSGVSITECTLTRGNGSSSGGGILASGGSLSISSSTIESCIGLSGAGMALSSLQQLTLVDTELRRNLASGDGGAILMEQTPFTIRGCTFERNYQPPPAAIRADRGGAVRAVSCAGVVEDTTFRDEAAAIRGGAWAQLGETVVMRRCVFDSTRSQVNGGALDIELAGVIRAENCLFVDGGAKFGAALAGAFGGRFEVDHCTFARGSASSAGGAIYVETSAFATVTNSILCCATQSELVACPAAGVQFTNSDIWNDDAQNLRAEFASGCPNPIGSAGNFSANPVFCDPGAVELRLAPGSPCIGAGSDGSDLGWAPAGCPQSVPVSVVPETWSRIKSRYRTGTEGFPAPH